ncbi:MAG: RNA polymerase sigma factor [Candidatus Woesearchaeota archaeon]
MMLSDEQIIEGCKKCNKKAQKNLYNKYALPLLYICLRYTHSRSEAEDILQEGFIKIFSNIRQYSEKGSFEGWLKRIMINTAITNYKQNKKEHCHKNIDEINETHIINNENYEDNEIDIDATNIKTTISNANFLKDDILIIINQLPDRYRIVFNLFVMENYSYKEIADILKINTNTLKSQLLRARKIIQKKLYELALKKQKNNIIK